MENVEYLNCLGNLDNAEIRSDVPVESFEMWCWRKISWTDRGWNEEVLQETNILQIVKRRRAD